MIPGEIRTQGGEVEFVPTRHRVTIQVKHTGDRPVQVGSHMHFYEVNRALDFERKQAWGKRLDIAAGTAVRFEPGELKTITLVDFGGDRILRGGNRLAEGAVDDPDVQSGAEDVLAKWQALGNHSQKTDQKGGVSL